MLPDLANHLWQSTVFAVTAGLLTLVLKGNSARARHRLWLIASLKFLVPFSFLIGIGSHMEWRAPQPVIPVAVKEVSQPFNYAASYAAGSAIASNRNFVAAALLALWLCGSLAVIGSWVFRWRRIRTVMRLAKPMQLPAPIPVVASPALLEPGIFGILQPVLILPEGIAGQLTAAQLDAVIAHELCHMRHRDNLSALIHMLVEAAFWFHPLVWWIGSRLIDERERACDEEVLHQGRDPQIYAESILEVCKLYFESPLECVSGITGSDLKRRVEAIMSHRVAQRLDPGRRFLLAALGTAAVAGPFVVGLMHAPAGRAQSPDDTARLEFEVASIKPNKSGAGEFSMGGSSGWTATNVSLRELVSSAYSVKPYQISGAPAWWDEDHFDIVAKCPPQTNSRSMRMLQTLLEVRFKLIRHWETKVMPGYAMVVAKTGVKLSPAEPGDGGSHTRGGRGRMAGKHITLAQVSGMLSGHLDRPVADMTGIVGFFDVSLQWTPDQAPANTEISDGPTIFTALQEQLGLKLEARKVPVPILVIDHLERFPTPN